MPADVIATLREEHTEPVARNAETPPNRAEGASNPDIQGGHLPGKPPQMVREPGLGAHRQDEYQFRPSPEETPMQPPTTYADLKYHDDVLTAGTDSSVPPRTFYAVARRQGRSRTYLLHGDVEHPDAVVIGRVDADGSAYAGNDLDGGEPIKSRNQDGTHVADRDLFATMLAKARENRLLDTERAQGAVEALQSLRNWIADHSAEAIDRQLLKRQIDLRIAALGGHDAFTERQGLIFGSGAQAED